MASNGTTRYLTNGYWIEVLPVEIRLVDTQGRVIESFDYVTESYQLTLELAGVYAYVLTIISQYLADATD